MHAQVILALILAASFSAQPAATQKAAPPVTDGWAGWWTVVSSGGDRPAVQIEKKGDVYDLRMAPYETQTFKEVSPGVLQCKQLGVIRRGKLSFTGLSEETVVLKAEFCYAIFYLYHVGPPN